MFSVCWESLMHLQLLREKTYFMVYSVEKSDAVHDIQFWTKWGEACLWLPVHKLMYFSLCLESTPISLPYFHSECFLTISHDTRLCFTAQWIATGSLTPHGTLRCMQTSATVRVSSAHPHVSQKKGWDSDWIVCCRSDRGNAWYAI